MKKHYIPAAPQSSFESVPSTRQQTGLQWPAAQQPLTASKHIAPLDAAFVSRTCRTTLWFGALLALCAYALTQTLKVFWSFGGGVALSALMLQSQTIMVRRLWRPKNAAPYAGWDARIPLWILLPGKYAGIFIGLGFLLRYHLIDAVWFVAGFSIVQFVIVAKVIGRLMVHNMRPLNEVYVNKGQPDVR